MTGRSRTTIRPRFRAIAFACVLACGSALGAVEPGEPRVVRTVGILYDGPHPGGKGLAPERLKDLAELIERETGLLTGQEFEVRFPTEKRISCGWNVDAIRAGVDRMLADPDVDIVLALGVFVGNEACRRPALPKPVLAPIAVDVQAQGLPTAVDATGRLTSGRTNLAYTLIQGSILRDVEAFRKIVPFSRLHVVAEDLASHAIPEIAEYNIAAGRLLGIDMILVSASGTAESVLSQLPADAQAVYLTPLHRLPRVEFDRLVEGLVRRRLPSFSLIGRSEVEQGVLAGVRPATDLARLARRVALNIQRVLLGEEPSTFPVNLDQVGGLVVNMRTAREVGVALRWRTRIEADLLFDEAGVATRSLTFFDAVDEALDANLSLALADNAVVAGEQAVAAARAAIRPQIDLTAAGLQVDRPSAEASFGSQAQSTVRAGVSVQQVLFSEPRLANLRIAGLLQESRRQDREARRLDVARAASVAFLNVLRAATLERVARENLELTESNLELAEGRERLGVSSPAERYRWESELATDRSDVISAINQTDTARVALNQVLHRPLDEVSELIPPSPDDPRMITCCERLDPFVDGPQTFRVFREFSVGEALAHSTEIRSLDAAIAAQERLLLSARRSFWTPQLTLSGNLERNVLRDGAGSGPNPLTGADRERDAWSVALSAGLPLYVGGRRQADARRYSEELLGLRLQRAALVEQIEARVLRELFAAGQTFPAIELAQEAAQAARKGLELVTDAYSSGVLSIIDLLDAQNAALVAEQFAANAVYDFLVDLMEVQRATSSLDFFSSEAGREAYFARLRAYFDRAGVRLREEVEP